MRTIELKFKGESFIPGVPARDLTKEEVERFGGKKALLESGAFEEPKKAAKGEDKS